MNKETFIKIFKLIQEQVEIDNKRMNALEKAFGPDNYILIENKLLDGLADILSQELNIDEDLFFSFIYEKDRTIEEISDYWEKYNGSIL